MSDAASTSGGRPVRTSSFNSSTSRAGSVAMRQATALATLTRCWADHNRANSTKPKYQDDQNRSDNQQLDRENRSTAATAAAVKTVSRSVAKSTSCDSSHAVVCVRCALVRLPVRHSAEPEATPRHTRWPRRRGRHMASSGGAFACRLLLSPGIAAHRPVGPDQYTFVSCGEIQSGRLAKPACRRYRPRRSPC